MQLKSGTRLGPYEITSLLGAGGMGEVYKAVDTRLDRSVALKILGPEFANNPSLVARFEREARAISQLTHPNICALYDLDLTSTQSPAYLVMELLEGENLADRLARGPLSVAQVLRHGAEIADALAAAHRRGIVHRDLKPGNVMMTKTGARLLDFGLARAHEVTIGPDAPTMQKPLTAEGMIIGTFQYMSPEQIEGGVADERSDIFALGNVLYEMATGRRAFDGKTKTSLIAAIVASEPQPLSSFDAAAPAGLDKVIRACLAKDPEDRLQSAHDVAVALRWTERDLSAGLQKPAGRLPRWVPGAAAILLAAAAAVGGWFSASGRNAREESVAFALTPPTGSILKRAAISPDGSRIAFTSLAPDGSSELWVQSVSETTPVLIRKGATGVPFWSPDGKWIAYPFERQLFKVQVSGGEPQVLCETAYGMGGEWLEDGTILFTPKFADVVYRVPSSGGKPVPVTKLSGRENSHLWPRALPGTGRFLYLVFTPGERNEMFAGSLDDPALRKRITQADSLIGYSPPFLIFARANSIYAQKFDPESLELSGEPSVIADGAYYYESDASSHASVSAGGALVYLPFRATPARIGWYDRSGRFGDLILQDDDIDQGRLSPDQRRLVYVKFDPSKGACDIYVLDVKRGIRTRVTSGPSNNISPYWSTDGTRIYFISDRSGPYDGYVQAADGATPARPMWGSGGADKVFSGQSPDGHYLLGESYTAESSNDLWLVPTVEGEKPRPLIATPASESAGALSDDGTVLGFLSSRSGRNEAYLQQFPEGQPLQISSAGAEGVSFGRNGECFYQSPDGALMQVSYTQTGKAIDASAPVRLFPGSRELASIATVQGDERFLVTLTDDVRETSSRFFFKRGWKASIPD